MRKRRENNSGFSLIELIIAIAILVILTGLLAPQFMKYIEKARRTKMIQNLENINEAIQLAYVDAMESGEFINDINEMMKLGKMKLDINPKESTLEKAMQNSLEESLGEVINNLSITIYMEERNSKYINLENIIIQYYPDPEDNTQCYYHNRGIFANNVEQGTFGEWKNGKYIKWK